MAVTTKLATRACVYGQRHNDVEEVGQTLRLSTALNSGKICGNLLSNGLVNARYMDTSTILMKDSKAL